jgi:hypothetical protein
LKLNATLPSFTRWRSAVRHWAWEAGDGRG